MNKKFWFVFCLLISCSAFSYTLVDAERAYVAKNWALANTAYAEVCPTLEGNKQIACSYWQILALSQTGKSREFQKAGEMLDSLIQKISPRDTLYSDLVMTRAQFEIYLKKYAKARESLLHAKETSKDSVSSVLLQVCALLEKSDPSLETKELCAGLKNPTRAVDSIAIASKDTLQKKVDSSVIFQDSVKAPKKSLETLYVLQLGAFSKRENAEALQKALDSRGIETVIVEKKSSERNLFLVHSKNAFSKEDAEKYGQKVFSPLEMDFSLVKKD